MSDTSYDPSAWNMNPGGSSYSSIGSYGQPPSASQALSFLGAGSLGGLGSGSGISGVNSGGLGSGTNWLSLLSGYGGGLNLGGSGSSSTPATGLFGGASSNPFWSGSGGFGFNAPSLMMGLQGLGTIGSLIAGFGQLGVANKQLALSTGMANANLQNQTQSYNTNLANEEAVRGAWEGQTPAQQQAYITANSLKFNKLGG